MERTIVVFLAIFCLVQCASLKGKDDHPHEPSHSRGKRCDVCGDGPPHHGPPHFGPPPPPPPPPFFRSLQYSGLARGNDGSQGIFSGAAAAADLNNQAAGQAFSVASSSAGAGAGGYGGQSGQSSYNRQLGQSNSFGKSSNEGQQAQSLTNGFGSSGQSNGFSGQSNLQTQTARGDGGLSSANSAAQSGNGAGYGQKQISGSGTFKESHYSFQSGGNKEFGSDGGNGGFNGQGVGNQASSSAYGGQQEQRGNSVGFHGTGHGYGHGPKSGKQELGFENQQQQSSSNGQWEKINGNHGFGNQQQQRSSNGQWEQGKNNDGFENQQQVQSSNGQWQKGDSSSASSSQSGSVNGKSGYGAGGEFGVEANGGAQSTLSGALGLASQGLQAAQQTQPACSTCGSGSYALSNAKSKSGNAVAVSIGG